MDLEEDQLVRIESVREDRRKIWVLTARGHREAKRLLEPKSIRVSVLRKQEYDPATGELLGTGYDDHATAVTSTAAELHRTRIGHRLGNGYVQRTDLVVRAPEAGVPVLLETDRRTEDALMAPSENGDDFPPPPASDQRDASGRAITEPVNEADARFAHVAVTRARSRLDLGGLAWVRWYEADWRTPWRHPTDRTLAALRGGHGCRGGYGRGRCQGS
ncbi:hypothetical protein ACWC4C_13645 [Streptomyces olivaceoviridis]